MPPVGDSYHIPLGMCLNPQIANLAVVGLCGRIRSAAAAELPHSRAAANWAARLP
jgi:hypothetical protein